ncbi:DNA-directed RNA polymerases I, II, and III subunit RPABC3 [Nematocida minor]|uniref:DNA-directed RNA polymerases I, II, and III subunit RPABC3 n=1 Tax=Nematocida minor TaxID=1912983 RepID=UPI00221E8909|nr:DNA-directed RNA polymerases I, II, and III subunit RPABC3 [Nematocida minor]KAI5191523.1 DNA-directed RNA polymerases I, II, and III subunit RPABC3 [Nematocida minor]
MKIFSESFTLSEIDPDGKAFDEVSRGVFVSEGCRMLMDYHTGLFTHKKMDRVNVAIFSDEDNFSEKDIPEKYSYLMGNGVIYKTEIKDRTKTVDISFSGLLVRMEMDPARMKETQRYKRLFLGVEDALG